MDQEAREIAERQARMEMDRMPFERLWNELARYLLPRQAEQFLGGGRWRGGPAFANPAPDRRVFDETAQLALERAIAIFLGYVMPRGQRFQMMVARDEELMKLRHVREWYEKKTAQLFALRSNPQSGFDTQAHESAASLLAFGMQGMWPEIRRDARGRTLGIFYRSEHIGGLYVQENAWGAVDVVHRKFTLTARQAAQKWADAAPRCVAKAMRDNQPDNRFDFLHVLSPNAKADGRRIDAAAMPVTSCYMVMGEDREVFDRGGYRTLPLIVSRFDKAPWESYGRSPGMTVLPAVRQCQSMVRSLVVAAELKGRPPLLAPEDGLDMMIRYAAGRVTYGGIDDMGNPTIRPMMSGADLSDAREMLNETRALIAQAFFNDLMLGDIDGLKSHVTDTQLMNRNQDKGVLLAPLGRQETEWFDPMGAREVDLMAELGLLDDMPGEVAEAGGAYQMRYENPLARAQRSEQVAGYFQMLNAITPLAQADPSVLQRFEQMFPMERVMPVLADVLGVPASMAATDEERAASKAAAAEQASAQQLLEAAPIVADTANSLSQMGASRAA